MYRGINIRPYIHQDVLVLMYNPLNVNNNIICIIMSKQLTIKPYKLRVHSILNINYIN